MQFLAKVLIVVLALAAQIVHFSRRVTVSVPTSPLMVPMLVDHCCVLTDYLLASDLFGFRRRGLPLGISAVALKLWLAHAALSTLPWHSMAVNVKGCSLLAQRHRPSFSVALTNGRQQAILHHGPLPSTGEFMQSARIACPCFTRPRFELGLSSRAPQISAKRVRLS